MRGFAGHDDDCGTLMSATAFGYVLASLGLTSVTKRFRGNMRHAAHKRWFHRWGVVMAELRPHVRPRLT